MKRSERAFHAFRTRVADLGGTVVEPTWLGNARPHRVICANGHECAPHPSNVKQGRGICRTCAGQDPRVAEAAFRACVAALGGVVVEPTWLGVSKPHRAICINGHECAPWPHAIQQGQKGVCSTCAGLDPRVAEAAFRKRVAELGGVVVEPTWLGVNRPHLVICAEGHTCAPHPGSVRQGAGLCLTCAGRDPRVAEAAFHARVAAFGGRVVEPTWLGTMRPHRVVCASGHQCAPLPDNLRAGQGLCRRCGGKVWDRLYVVVNSAVQRVKFGVTSTDFRRRLGDHRRAGYVDAVRLVEIADADKLERAVLATLRLAEIAPVQGREHYDLAALPVILDVVDHWKGVPGAISA